MDGLKEAIEDVAQALAEAEKQRDLALAESRKIIRLSKNVIHAINVGSGYDEPKKEMEDRMHSLVWNVSEDMLLHGPAADAMMEFAEAEILSDVVTGAKVRTAEDMGITPQAWIMGLADTIGEIRRVIVGCLMNGDTDRAKALFAAMEEISEELLMMDVPDAIVPLRRKQDIARGIMDKTRSDMLGATVRRS